MSNATAPRRKGTFLPPHDLDAVLDLSLFLEQHTEPAALLGPDGQQIPLPVEVYEVLTKVVNTMAQHQAVSIAPVDQKLTTQEAADMLSIGRPTLIKLIEQNKIPSETLDGSRHRRITLGALLDYQAVRARERREALESMVHDAEHDELYGVDPQSYADAIRGVRKGEKTTGE